MEFEPSENVHSIESELVLAKEATQNRPEPAIHLDAHIPCTPMDANLARVVRKRSGDSN